MNKIVWLALCVVLILLTSCEEYGVQLRIENRSQFDFQEVSVNNVSFGAVEKSKQSQYLPFENLYSKEFVQVVINDKVLKFIPEQFDQEDFRSSGDYTYSLDIIDQKYISLRFKTD